MSNHVLRTQGFLRLLLSALDFRSPCTLLTRFASIPTWSAMDPKSANQTEFPPEIVRILALPAAVAMSKIQPLLPHLSTELLEKLSRTPIIPPPPGIEPNYDHPELMKRPHTISTSIVLVFAIILFSNRVYAKAVLAKKATLDDGTLTLGFLCSVIYYVVCTYGVVRGEAGIHLYDMNVLRASNLNFLLRAYITTLIVPVTFLFIKCSFFILYLQIFSAIRWLRICSYIGLAVTITTYLTCMTIFIVIWGPPKGGESWFPNRLFVSTSELLRLSGSQASLGLIIDVYILTLPIIGVKNLRINRKKKIGIILTFLSGLSACVCAAFSIYYRMVIDDTLDVTWYIVPLNIATLVEMFVGVSCACAPAVAYVSRQQNSLQSRVLRSISSHFESMSSSRPGKVSSYSLSRQQNSEQPVELDLLASTDKKYARFFNSHAGTGMESQMGNIDATLVLEEPRYPSATASRAASTTGSRAGSDDRIEVSHIV